MTTATREQGTVQAVLRGGSFGFIRPDERGPDVFVHISGLSDEARDGRRFLPGARVEYEVVPSPKGPRAERVRMLDLTTAATEVQR